MGVLWARSGLQRHRVTVDLEGENGLLRRIRCVLDLQGAQGESAFRGIGRYSLNLARAMARAAGDHEVWIALSGLFPETAAALRTEFSTWIPNDRIVVFSAPSPVSELDPANQWRRKAAELIREHFLAALQPDIVHISSMVEGFADDSVTSLQADSSRHLNAVTFYDAIPLLYPDPYLHIPGIANYYFRKLQWMKRADLLLAISESSRREAIRTLNVAEERVVNISTGLEERFKQVEVGAEAKSELFRKYGIQKSFLMYSGATDMRKNMEGLIAAFALLPASLRNNYQLLLAGKNEQTRCKQLQSLCRQHGLPEDRLIFAGYVSDNDLLALYNTCSLFVLPSYHEGFGLPALEAMACGTPTIASNVTSLPEVVGDPEALFDPGDPSEIAAKIERVLTDHSLREQLRRNGLRQAKNFTWERSARAAWTAFEDLSFSKQLPGAPVETTNGSGSRPTLAYFSPLPPERSGISDYSAELLPELGRFYDIEVVVSQDGVSDKWVNANFPVRSASYFERHAAKYDRIVYHIGNSPFHIYMLDVLRRYPGVVVLHDFFLSGMYKWMAQNGDLESFSRAIFDSHSYFGLLQEQKLGRECSIRNLPCNRPVIDAAAGVIVHSQFSRKLANQWYGPGTSSSWEVIPHLRSKQEKDREAARARLGIPNSDYLVCSFGLVDPTKLNDGLLSGWLGSGLANNKNCRLVFVGENNGAEFGANLLSRIAQSVASDRIRITGYSSREVYRDYLSAADCAVQLRTNSRGETSGAVLDCLGAGQPTIVNAHASLAELPDNVVLKLPDEFTDVELARALDQIYRDKEYRTQLSDSACEFVRSYLHPARIAERYHEAIENFATSHPMTAEQRLISRVATISVTTTPSHADSAAASRAISMNRRNDSPQLMLDVSATARNDLKTGIERATRNLSRELINNPRGWRVEPIRMTDGRRVYARRFGLGLVGSQLNLEEPEVEYRSGDLYLALDWCPETVTQDRSFFSSLQARNVPIYFLIYDVLPLVMPEKFPDWAVTAFRNWFAQLCGLADGLVCISRSVADQVWDWLELEQPNRAKPLKIAYSYCGADVLDMAPVDASAPDAVPEDAVAALAAMKARPTLLMVGTLEPRKGHTQALDAFEMLWADGTDANLVIIGHEGWHMEALTKRLSSHRQLGNRLFWLNAADDRVLADCYLAASGLLAASEAEGFGLPLIEAARYGLPIVARDIPVFREVAGEHAFYFQGTAAESLKQAIGSWSELYDHGEAPPSSGLQWLTWAESAKRFVDCIVGQEFYLEWRPLPLRSTEEQHDAATMPVAKMRMVP